MEDFLVFSEYLNFNTYLAEAIVVYPVEPGDFTSGDINTPLGHHTNTPLRIRCLEGIDIVDEWGFGGDLKITDHTVTLKLKEKLYEIIFFFFWFLMNFLWILLWFLDDFIWGKDGGRFFGCCNTLRNCFNSASFRIEVASNLEVPKIFKSNLGKSKEHRISYGIGYIHS